MQGDLLPANAAESVTIDADGRLLTLHQAGAQRQLAAGQLRQACKCAACSAARLTGAEIPSAPEIRIVAATPIGGYALNLAFSDGHARGVFPFSYLANLHTESAA